MDDTQSLGDITPFAQSALTYYRKGWQDVFPLGTSRGPQYAKAPVPAGVTGYDAGPVGFERIEATLYAPAGRRNIGARMPRTVICLDVDQYDGHDGMATLRAAESALGPLPAAPRNSARGRTDSGHRYYRVPLNHIPRPDAEERLRAAHGPNIEILHYGRRYAVVWPSLNPDAGHAQYLWYSASGYVLDEPPCVWELPVLPGPWAELLAAPIGSEESRRRPGSNLRAQPVDTGVDGDLFDDPRQPWRRTVAEGKAYEHLRRVLAMRDGEVNKTLGGAGIVFARLAEAGMFTPEQAMELLIRATRKNGVHSDAWNKAHRKGWTLDSRLADAFAQGLAKPPIIFIENGQPGDVYGTLSGLVR